MTQSDELQRLRQVYDAYSASEEKQYAWSDSNPGNRAMYEERSFTVRSILEYYAEILEGPVLDIGCGSGNTLAWLQSEGVDERKLHGIDVHKPRIVEAHTRYPGNRFILGDASKLPFRDDNFSLIFLFTVFSSVLDTSLSLGIAREAMRVLRHDGMILLYDFRRDNPWNPNVRGIRASEIRQLFAGMRIEFRRITLLPPLARRLGPLTGVLYPLLSALPLLRTHYLCTMHSMERSRERRA